MTLIYLERHSTFSVYTTHDGEEICLAHGPGFRVLIDFDFDTIAGWWAEFSGDREEFLTELSTRLTEPVEADAIAWCQQCGDIGVTDDYTHVESGDLACDYCLGRHYTQCSACDDYCIDTHSTLIDSEVCEHCSSQHFSWCEDCNGLYPSEDSGDHNHPDPEPDPERSCCESPQFTFLVRNDGDPPLVNDTRVTITLPAGNLDSTGIQRIRRLLRDEYLYNAGEIVLSMDPRWQTKEGNFTKRLSRETWKTHQEKIPAAVLSRVGTIAAEHSRSVDFAIEMTRNLNMEPEHFGHRGSCWWQSYSSSRCCLKTNGGFGMRSFDPYVEGRAWVMPLRAKYTQVDNATVRQWGRAYGHEVAPYGPISNGLLEAYKRHHGWASPRLTPTFDTLTPDAFVTFNGYGQLDGYNAARILAHMAGMTYRKIQFECPPMYVNHGANGPVGYLVAPESIAESYTDGLLRITTEIHSDLFVSETAAQSNTEEFAHV